MPSKNRCKADSSSTVVLVSLLHISEDLKQNKESAENSVDFQNTA
jgi:hypothetical protein